jgi:hypothetical protein
MLPVGVPSGEISGLKDGSFGTGVILIIGCSGERTGGGASSLRSTVPDGVPINPAPPENAPRQQTPQTVADSISELIRKRSRN